MNGKTTCYLNSIDNASAMTAKREICIGHRQVQLIETHTAHYYQNQGNRV